ncbi:MAG: NUDIX hydrolase [Anaerolineales bacterium]
MISFVTNGVRFNYRVVGVALHDGHVLLHRAERDNFWALPGGRGELLETSAETLRREMLEELKQTVVVERLVWVVENFFEYESTPFHELAFYWLMSFPADVMKPRTGTPFYGYEQGLPVIFQWFPVDALEQLELYPTFLKRGLQSLPATVTHIVHRDVKPKL